jgi:HAD superfamily hydrolase (TIGR01662 family)
MTTYELLIFDIDGTIADRDTHKLLPGVERWIDEFSQQAQSTVLAFATNQGGVGLRYWMESEGFGEPEKFPSEDDAMNHIHTVIDHLGLDERMLYYYLLVCFAYQSKKSGKWGPTPENSPNPSCWRQDWRKPSPGMLLQAMEYAIATPEKTLMIGDSDEDREAAEAAGIRFIHRDDWFGDAE